MQTIDQPTSRSQSARSSEDEAGAHAPASRAAARVWVAATPAVAVLVLAGAGMNWLVLRGLHSWAIAAAVVGFLAAFGIFAVLYARLVQR